MRTDASTTTIAHAPMTDTVPVPSAVASSPALLGVTLLLPAFLDVTLLLPATDLVTPLVVAITVLSRLRLQCICHTCSYLALFESTPRRGQCVTGGRGQAGHAGGAARGQSLSHGQTAVPRVLLSHDSLEIARISFIASARSISTCSCCPELHIAHVLRTREYVACVGRQPCVAASRKNI